MHFRLIPIFLFLFLFCRTVQAQKATKIEIIQSNALEFDEKISADAQRLVGNVIFKHNNAIMYCDSAYFYGSSNNLDAFGNVKITQGDTVSLTGNLLNYNGNDQIAKVTGNVVMKDRKMTLKTKALDYNMASEMAYYKDSATIIDAENTLTSIRGYYYSNSKDLFFKEKVVLSNPRYTMNGDSLKYNTISKIAFLTGPTYIKSNNNIIYTEDGWYNTIKQTSAFQKNAYLLLGQQLLKGDSILYDRSKGRGTAIGRVSIIDTANAIVIKGDYGEHHERNDSSFVTGHALFIQYENKDSLYLHADTLKAIADTAVLLADSSTARILLAYHGVKIFKKDLQGSCDSLVYDGRDSTMLLFKSPVLWSGPNQLTADSINIKRKGKELDKIYLNTNALIISQHDTLQLGLLDSIRFNQIKGKRMTGFFSNNELFKIYVEGNGQTIYYGKNKNEQTFGVNRADCSNLILYLDSNEVKSISLLQKPDATLYPLKDLKTSELRLKGFKWLVADRPKDISSLFIK